MRGDHEQNPSRTRPDRRRGAELPPEKQGKKTEAAQAPEGEKLVMHTCPDCDQACYCSGDIEDHDSGLEFAEDCEHDCDPQEDDGYEDRESK